MSFYCKNVPNIHAPIFFVKSSPNAITPTRGSKQAAGIDLYSAYEYILPPNERILVKTDIQITLPDGCYGRIAPRSGLAYKHFLDVFGGVIDRDYRGNIVIILVNFGKEEYKINKGDRVAQLILERIFSPFLKEVPLLKQTERGEAGFGSTGKNYDGTFPEF